MNQIFIMGSGSESQCAYYLFAGSSVHTVFWYFSEEIIPYVAVYFSYPWEVVSSGSLHTAIFNPTSH